VIPSIRSQVLTLKSLEGLPAEIIIERSGPNNDVARNLGVKKSKNSIVVIMDDDIAFPQSWFIYYVRKVRKGVAFWNDPPMTLFVTKEDFIAAGGFDESIKGGGGEYELRLALENVGVKVELLNMENVYHLGKVSTFSERNLPHNLRYDMLAWRHTTLAWLRYKPIKKWIRIFLWIRNPINIIKIAYSAFICAIKGENIRKKRVWRSG
jgi:GT2 family glycosyltransferase